MAKLANGATAKPAKADVFANVAYGTVTMSAANTLTFAQIMMGVGLFQGIAMLLARVNYRPTAGACREMVAATDAMYMALVTSNRLSSIVDVSDPSIIDQKQIVGIGVPVANWDLPLVTDYTSLPGGGKLISANPLYVAMNQAGAAAAGTLRVQLDFTFLELNDRDYLELIQAQFPANIA